MESSIWGSYKDKGIQSKNKCILLVSLCGILKIYSVNVSLIFIFIKTCSSFRKNSWGNKVSPEGGACSEDPRGHKQAITQHQKSRDRLFHIFGIFSYMLTLHHPSQLRICVCVVVQSLCSQWHIFVKSALPTVAATQSSTVLFTRL